MFTNLKPSLVGKSNCRLEPQSDRIVYWVRRGSKFDPASRAAHLAIPYQAMQAIGCLAKDTEDDDVYPQFIIQYLRLEHDPQKSLYRLVPTKSWAEGWKLHRYARVFGRITLPILGDSPLPLVLGDHFTTFSIEGKALVFTINPAPEECGDPVKTP